MLEENLPQKVRVSIGSAIILGLAKGKLDAEPTTVYILTYRRGRCLANCAFCPQSKGSDARTDMLSRVVWPIFRTVAVFPQVARTFEEGKIKRVCIQALNYPGMQENIICLARGIRALSNIPISVSCQPLNSEGMNKLLEAGVNRVGIALDAVTEEIFDKVKGTSTGGPYCWERHLETLREAVEIFGRGSVTTHLIMGLGEKEEEFVGMIQRCVDLCIYPALFAFTPIPGTSLAAHHPPNLNNYRWTQVAHYLITRHMKRFEEMKFRDGHLIDFDISNEELRKIVSSGEPFETSGCNGCNRPYYNERPRGSIYNYPRKPTIEEIEKIERQMGI